jgi:ribosome biogenesis GTPase A
MQNYSQLSYRRSIRRGGRSMLVNFLFLSVILTTTTTIMRFPFPRAAAFVSQFPKVTTKMQRSKISIHATSPISRQYSYLQQKNSRLNNNSNFNNMSEDIVAEFSSKAGGGYNRPGVQWYPGHIAKAERQLSETLKAVDVVVEVRDARACKATSHPRVGEWCAGRPRIVVLTHLDMIPKAAANSWRKAYEKFGAEDMDDAPINRQVANQAKQARDIRYQFDDNKESAAEKKKRKKSSTTTKSSSVDNKNITPVEQVLFVNAKQGQGIHALHRAIFKAGSHVQERRERRGLNPRALRVGIIGYPNVGKVS